MFQIAVYPGRELIDAGVDVLHREDKENLRESREIHEVRGTRRWKFLHGADFPRACLCVSEIVVKRNPLNYRDVHMCTGSMRTW